MALAGFSSRPCSSGCCASAVRKAWKALAVGEEHARFCMIRRIDVRETNAATADFSPPELTEHMGVGVSWIYDPARSLRSLKPEWPARSRGVKGCGKRRSHLRKTRSVFCGVMMSQMPGARAGSPHERTPSSSASNAMPALSRQSIRSVLYSSQYTWRAGRLPSGHQTLRAVPILKDVVHLVHPVCPRLPPQGGLHLATQHAGQALTQ